MASFADAKYNVTFTSSTGLRLSVLAGQTSATLTDGFGGWEAIDRPKRVAMSRWKGRPLFRQDVPILFDGVDEDKNVEVDIATLIRMSQPAGALTPPPTVKITGPVERTDLVWVIENITWEADMVVRDMQTGGSVRMRQGAVVHLLQYIDDKLILTPPRPKVAGKVVDGADKTAKRLSQDIHGTPDFWKLFQDANLGVIKSPRQKIPKGTKVVIPPITGANIGTLGPGSKKPI